MGAQVLVGSTGLVGQNLLRSRDFDLAVHSTDVDRAFGADRSLVVYAGVPGTKHLVNRDPESDLRIILDARENLRRIGAEKVVLISTVDVYGDSRGKTEDDEPGGGGLTRYGEHRLRLEGWVREDFPDALIVRLPAIYGVGLKKNFVHDVMHPAPPLLAEEAYRRLSRSAPLVEQGYAPAANGFFVLRSDRAESLDAWFADQGFNALSYTDSRSRFQFYPLDRLWDDITATLEGDVRLLNIAVPPVSAGEAYECIFGKAWTNHRDAPPADYDMRSIHYPERDGSPGYLCTKEEELQALRRFVLG